jgi:hypothetical protein
MDDGCDLITGFVSPELQYFTTFFVEVHALSNQVKAPIMLLGGQLHTVEPLIKDTWFGLI